MLWLITLLLVAVTLAAASVDIFPKGASLNAQRLAQVRRDYLQPEARGPLKSVHLRYRDVWRGQQRTFVWSAQSYTNPDGALAYGMVLGQVKPKGVDYVVAAGCNSLSLDRLGGEDPDGRYQVVYRALQGYVREHNLTGQLQP